MLFLLLLLLFLNQAAVYPGSGLLVPSNKTRSPGSVQQNMKKQLPKMLQVRSEERKDAYFMVPNEYGIPMGFKRFSGCVLPPNSLDRINYADLDQLILMMAKLTLRVCKATSWRR